MNEYVAFYKDGTQITEDNYKVVTPSLKLTDATTIGQIKAWAGNNMLGGITVVELTAPAPVPGEKG